MCDMQLNGTLVSLHSSCCSKLVLECIAFHPTGVFIMAIQLMLDWVFFYANK